MSRRTYIAGANARQRCARCGRLLREGQRITVTVTPSTHAAASAYRASPAVVTYKHAGRTCPPVFNRRPL